MSTREAAVAAARRGWAVFPTRPGGKEPRRGLSWPGAATADPRRVAIAHWRPGENYGVAAKRSGLVILDLDKPKPGYELPPGWRDEPGIRDGRDVLATLAGRAGMPWPCTFTVLTPSEGQHLYYRAPDGRRIGNHPAGPLLDVRGGGDSHGGYVLGPGSVLAGRAYRVADDQDPQPLPAWIADLLDPPRPAPVTGVSVPPGLADRIASRLDSLIAVVIDAQPGERNNVLHWAACRAAEMITAGQLTPDQVHGSLEAAAVLAGLPEHEAEHTIASALHRTLVRSTP